jgi:hypothetical protein
MRAIPLSQTAQKASAQKSAVTLVLRDSAALVASFAIALVCASAASAGDNTSDGDGALPGNTGSQNSAFGEVTLDSNTTASETRP